MKRKLADNDNVHTNYKDKRLKIGPEDNLFKTMEETSSCTRSSVLKAQCTTPRDLKHRC